MPIRRTFQYNTPNQSVFNDGFQLSNYTDFHCRLTGANSGKKPYFYDVDNPDLIDCVEFGDRLGYKANSQASLPVYIVSGLHLYQQSKNANYQLQTDDTVLNFDTSGGDLTLTLPLSTTFNNTKIVYVNKTVRANKLIITPSGAETISGYTGASLYITNPNYAMLIVSDRAAGMWRIFNADCWGIQLSREFPVNPNISVSGVNSVMIRQYLNVPVSSRDFRVSISGSGWYNNNETSRVRFFVRLDNNGATDINLCTWHNADSMKNISFAGSAILSSTPGLHTVDIRARLDQGGNTFTMDGNGNFFNCDITQF